MAMFDPELPQAGGVSQVQEPVRSPDILGTMVNQVRELIGSGARLTAPKPGVSDSSVYKAAALRRKELEAEDLLALDEAEQAMAEYPEMFEDGTLSDEEAKLLRYEEEKVRRIKGLSNSTARRARLNMEGRKFLNTFGEDVKPEVIDKVLKLYDVQTTNEVVQDRYGDAVYNETNKLYTNPTPLHYILTARRNRDIAAVEDTNRAMDLAFKRGKVAAADIQTAYGSLLESNAVVDLAVLKEEFDTKGFVDSGTLSWFANRRAQDTATLKAQINESIASARESGATIEDPQGLLDAVDKMATPWKDISAKLGTDPDFNKRADQLFQTLAKIPELAAGANITQLASLAAANDIALPTLLSVLSRGKGRIAEDLRSLGIPTLDEDEITRAAKLLTNTMIQTMNMDASKIPDQSQRKLQQYIASMWAGKTPGRDGVPTPVVTSAMDALDQGSTDEVFFYLNSQPGFVKNVQTAQQSERLVAQVRNNLVSLVDELEGKTVQRDAKTGKYVVYSAAPGTTARGEFSGIDKGSIDTKLSLAVNNAKSFLSSTNAKTLLGGDRELTRLLEVVEPGSTAVNSTKGATFDDLRKADGDLSKLSDAEVRDLRERVRRSSFDAAPGSSMATRLSTVAGRLDQRLGAMTGQIKREAPERRPGQVDTTNYKQNRATIAPIIRTTAAEAGVDPDLAVAMAHAESKFDNAAVSHAGAVGVLQVMPATAKGYGFDPETIRTDVSTAVQAGVQHLQFLNKIFPEGTPFREEKIVASYNWGHKNVKDLLAKPGMTWGKAKARLPGETKKYLKEVLDAMEGDDE